jgi:hypothetical protein
MSDETHLTDAPRENTCPECGRVIAGPDAPCPHCGAGSVEAPDVDVRRVRRRRAPRADDPVQFLVPTNVSGWSIVACYAGFIGMCLPLFGLVFAIPAFICGIVALCKRKRTVSYGSVTSDIRAILGLVFSSVAILLWGGIILFVSLSRFR